MYITSRPQPLAQEKSPTVRRSPLATPGRQRELPQRKWTPSQPIAQRGDVLPTLLPGGERDISWAEFCERYLATELKQTMRSSFNTFDERFRRICKPARLAVVNQDTLTQFTNALLDEGWTADKLRRRAPHFRAAIKWGIDAGLIDPSQFDVHRVPAPRSTASPVAGYRWQWRALDGRPNYRLVGESAA
jgi:hypothetical protein